MIILNVLNLSGLNYPKSGGQNRFYALTKEMINKGNQVIVLEPEEFYHPDDDKVAKTYCYVNLKFFNRTLFVFRDFNLSFFKELRMVINSHKIDLIMLSHPSGLLATKLALLLSKKRIPIIYDAHNVETDFTKETFVNNKKYYWFERLAVYLNIMFLERIGCKYMADHITCVSKNDREAFIRKYKLNPQKLSVIPSGCDVNNFEMLSEQEKEKMKAKYGIDPSTVVIVFHGLYGHPPNKEAFDLIQNYISPKFNNKAVLFLTGGTDCPIMKKGNFSSLGFIEDLSEYLSMADIAIVPLRHGGGTKLKVFDYMASGLPIVTTKKGIEGIEAEDGKHVLITDDVNEEFINAIQYLIEDENERKSLGLNARRLAEDKYDWSKIGEKLTLILDHVRGA